MPTARNQLKLTFALVPSLGDLIQLPAGAVLVPQIGTLIPQKSIRARVAKPAIQYGN